MSARADNDGSFPKQHKNNFSTIVDSSRVPPRGPITQACASRMNKRQEGVSADLDGVHSGFPKEFTNLGLDLSIFPE